MTDPANAPRNYRITAAICWIVIFGIVALVLVKNTLNYEIAADRPLTNEVRAPDVSLEITSRMLIGQTNLQARIASVTNPTVFARQRDRMIATIDAASVTAADKLNAVPVIGELAGADFAIKRLDKLAPQLAPNALLAGDAKVLRGIYMRGTESVSASERDGLLDRHEWFGELALIFGLPASDPHRQTLIHSVVQTTVTGGISFIVIAAAFLVGVVLLILGIVFLNTGRLRLVYRPGLPVGPPVFLETFAIWLTSWVAISFFWHTVGVQLGTVMSEVIAVGFSGVVALWPVWRGAHWLQLRNDLGWNAGRGVPREILAGVVGYIAGLPVVGVGFLFTTILITRSHTHPSHPILRDLGAGGGTLSVIGIYAAACVLAPVIEETMFRGALYHHLRRCWRVIISAFVVSIIFAAIHPQGWPVIPMLGSIGFVLAMIREWRGSLIAGMTAHGLNNAAGVTIVILLLR